MLKKTNYFFVIFTFLHLASCYGQDNDVKIHTYTDTNGDSVCQCEESMNKKDYEENPDGSLVWCHQDCQDRLDAANNEIQEKKEADKESSGECCDD